jgi:hypothetical protein
MPKKEAEYPPSEAERKILLRALVIQWSNGEYLYTPSDFPEFIFDYWDEIKQIIETEKS